MRPEKRYFLISRDTTRILEAFRCGGDFWRVDLWIIPRSKKLPHTRQWLILTDAEWRRLRRLRPR